MPHHNPTTTRIPEGLAGFEPVVEAIASRTAERVVEQLPDRPEPYMDVAEAAAYLSAPRSRIYELAERRRISERTRCSPSATPRSRQGTRCGEDEGGAPEVGDRDG